MDKIDIFDMPMNANIITTIEELQRLYFMGIDEGHAAERSAIIGIMRDSSDDETVLVHGDIV